MVIQFGESRLKYFKRVPLVKSFEYQRCFFIYNNDEEAITLTVLTYIDVKLESL